MSRPRDSILWGILLLLIGAAFLLWNLGVLASYETTVGWIAVGLFGVLGVAMLVAQVLGPQAWWRVIPGMTLLGIAAVVLLSIQKAPPVWVASSLFLAIALAFLIIYFGDRQERWWAFVPFGAMAVMVAVMVLSNAAWPPLLVGVALFAGMGLVFFIIYALAKDRRTLAWALVPAAALALMALVTLTAYLASLNAGMASGMRFWPVLVLVLGVVLLGYGITRRSKASVAPMQFPTQPAASDGPRAPGTSVLAVDDDVPPPPRSRRFERSPITLHDQPASSTAAPEQDLGGADLNDYLNQTPPGDAR